MDPNTSMTVRDFGHAAWALAIGLLAPYVSVVPLFWWRERHAAARISALPRA
jgi:hypothetical protein